MKKITPSTLISAHEDSRKRREMGALLKEDAIYLLDGIVTINKAVTVDSFFVYCGGVLLHEHYALRPLIKHGLVLWHGDHGAVTEKGILLMFTLKEHRMPSKPVSRFWKQVWAPDLPREPLALIHHYEAMQLAKGTAPTRSGGRQR